MSDTGRDGDLVPDATKDNYRALRLERGWSWEQLAEQFVRDRVPQLAAWATREDEAEKAAQERGREKSAGGRRDARRSPAAAPVPVGPPARTAG